MPKWFWGIAAVIGLIIGILWASPELRALLIIQIERVALAAPTRSFFPPHCAPLRVSLPAGLSGPELRVYFKDSNEDLLLHCNPAALRDSKASTVTDIGRFRWEDWHGARATISLNSGSGVLGVADTPAAA